MKARDVYATPDGFVDLTVEVGTPGFTFTRIVGEVRTVTHLTAPDFLLSGRVAVDKLGVMYALLCDMKSTHYLVDEIGNEMCRILQGGRGSCALWPLKAGVEIHAQGVTDDGGATAPITVYNDSGLVIPNRTYRAPYSSEGILQVTGPESIRSSAASARGFDPLITLWNAVEAEGFWAGQINRVPPGGELNNGTVGIVSPQGNIFIAALTPGWNGYTNQPAYLAVQNGKPRLALQDPSPDNHTPGPDDLHWLKLDEHGNLPAPEQPPVEEKPRRCTCGHKWDEHSSFDPASRYCYECRCLQFKDAPAGTTPPPDDHADEPVPPVSETPTTPPSGLTPQEVIEVAGPWLEQEFQALPRFARPSSKVRRAALERLRVKLVEAEAVQS